MSVIPNPKLKKKIKISDVWNYFTRSADKKFAKCVNCQKEYKTSGNTSNLRDHLKRFHPNLNTNAASSDTPPADTLTDESNIPSTSSSCRSSMRSVETYFKRSFLYDSDSKRKKDIDYSLAVMVAKDVQPYSIVEDEGFADYSYTLDPRYKLPSRSYLRDVLMAGLFKKKLRISYSRFWRKFPTLQ